MKSRISFFNGALFRKNVTRFAPAWVLYSVFLVLIVVNLSNGDMYYSCVNLSDQICFFGIYNLLYALLVAQLLFGDLYNSRMCNALHALPMRRETWFGTHVITGLFFSLIPNALASLLAVLFLGKYCIIAVYFLMGISLSYLLFFGIAVFCVFCVGNRFAMVLVYGIANFFTIVLSGIITTLYDPLVYGIELNTDWLAWFYPLAQIASTEYLEVTEHTLWEAMELGLSDPISIEVGNWWYLILSGFLGLALIAAALQLYRRRQLESAGDFIVLKPLAPVFLILYTLAAGCLLYLITSLSGSGYFFLFVGIAIGFFTGLMLLKRTIRVFNKKTWLGFGAFVAVLAVSLLLTWLDPIGFTRYVPETEDVESVFLTTGYHGDSDGFTTKQPVEIEDISRLHSYAIQNRIGDSDWEYASYHLDDSILFELTYTLKNGRTVKRNYYMIADSEMGQVLEKYMSRPETIFGPKYRDIESYAALIERISLEDDVMLYTSEDIRGFLTAMVADCEAGAMAYDYAFHDGNNVWGDIELRKVSDDVYHSDTYRSFRIWSECTNTIAWLRNHGYDFENGTLAETKKIYLS